MEGVHLAGIDVVDDLRAAVSEGPGHATIVFLERVPATHTQEGRRKGPGRGVSLDDADRIGEARTGALRFSGQVAGLAVLQDGL